MSTSLFIHLSHVLAVVDSAAMNIEMHILMYCYIVNYSFVWVYSQEWDCKKIRNW